MHPKVRFSPPAIGQAEIDAVVETLKSGWLTSGPKTAEFEKAFAQMLGCKHAIAVSSCTAGLTLALVGLGIGKGDKVATSVMTFTATVEAIVACGAEPVLVDVEADTLNIDVRLLEKTIEADPQIRAVIPVHFAGLACEMDEIENLCRSRGILIVEDAAHALPTRHNNRMIGTIGDATVFSFYASKTVTTGEGGMIATADDVLADRLRRMRLHGIRKPQAAGPEGTILPWNYNVDDHGAKCNLGDIASALGTVQLARCSEMHAARIAIAKTYFESLSSQTLALPCHHGSFDDHSWHLFVIRFDLSRTVMSRNAISAALLGKGIETSVHFRPIHMHSYWSRILGTQMGEFPVAESAYETILSLPIHPGMDKADALNVAASIRSLLSAA